MIKITVKPNIINSKIEDYIIHNIKISFGEITSSELDFLQQKIYNKFNQNINIDIIRSIKSSYIKDYIIKHSYRLQKYSKYILKQYKQQINIMDISNKLLISPISILRYIFNIQYDKKLKELINNNLLNNYDKKQYEIAEQNDIYNNLDQTIISIEAMRFEKSIETFLIKNNVDFLTQEQLTNEQITKYNHAIITPDFLIKSDLYINNHQIRWIDAKNFYGANIDFIKTKIKKQIQKYIKSFGPGCIIFNHGLNSNIKFDNVILLNYQSFYI